MELRNLVPGQAYLLVPAGTANFTDTPITGHDGSSWGTTGTGATHMLVARASRCTIGEEAICRPWKSENDPPIDMDALDSSYLRKDLASQTYAGTQLLAPNLIGTTGNNLATAVQQFFSLEHPLDMIKVRGYYFSEATGAVASPPVRLTGGGLFSSSDISANPPAGVQRHWCGAERNAFASWTKFGSVVLIPRAMPDRNWARLQVGFGLVTPNTSAGAGADMFAAPPRDGALVTLTGATLTLKRSAYWGHPDFSGTVNLPTGGHVVGIVLDVCGGEGAAGTTAVHAVCAINGALAKVSVTSPGGLSDYDSATSPSAFAAEFAANALCPLPNAAYSFTSQSDLSAFINSIPNA